MIQSIFEKKKKKKKKKKEETKAKTMKGVLSGALQFVRQPSSFVACLLLLVW